MGAIVDTKPEGSFKMMKMMMMRSLEKLSILI
jgi:hypothetical protein